MRNFAIFPQLRIFSLEFEFFNLPPLIYETFLQTTQYSLIYIKIIIIIHTQMIQSPITMNIQQYDYEHTMLIQTLMANNIMLMQKIRQMQEELEFKQKNSQRSTSEEVSSVQKEKSQRVNDTKNIPKNYGKAIICFIQQNPEIVQKIFDRYPQKDVKAYLKILNIKKRKINSIAELRQMWSDEDEYGKITRLLSQLFLRKYSLKYIFNSRVTNYSNHIKYRYRLLEALRKPEQFHSIKEF